MPTCKIQWIDNQGNPTPDDNPAIGTAVCYCGLHPKGSSAPLPICAEHLARIQAERMYQQGWVFTPYPHEHCPNCGAGLEQLLRYYAYTTTYEQRLHIVDGMLDLDYEKEVSFEPAGDITWVCEACQSQFSYDIAVDWVVDETSEQKGEPHD